jgi:sugar lactone lactonase YvrE
MLIGLVTYIVLGSILTNSHVESGRLVWPPAPDTARLEYVGQIACEDLTPRGGFLSKIKRLIGGKSNSDDLSLPFDVVATERSLFLVCQNIGALIEVDRKKEQFRLHQNSKKPLIHPVSLCDGGEGRIFITDSQGRAVFIYSDGKIQPLIDSGLTRPTGIAAIPSLKRLFIVDTGEHNLKVYNYDGRFIKTVFAREDSLRQLNYPTFAASSGKAEILLNDALNHEIKRIDADGKLIHTFGQEGDGPGTFSRPKGIAVDSDDHIYVVDNLFDNVQVFDVTGRILLAFGSAGQSVGQFWSPAGIDILNDTIYVADTYNNRIQIFRYLGGAR